MQYFNYQYKRTGTLWEGRYKSTLLDSEMYLLTCYVRQTQSTTDYEPLMQGLSYAHHQQRGNA